MTTIGDTIRYEAIVCSNEVCGQTIVHEIKTVPWFTEPELCSLCCSPMTHVTNPSVVLSLAYKAARS
jgi:hypothetical protein